MPTTHIALRINNSHYILWPYHWGGFIGQIYLENIANHDSPGPCITNVIATCRKKFSQWERSFLWKLRCHWLKFLRHVAKTLVIQGPGAGILFSYIFSKTTSWYAMPGFWGKGQLAWDAVQYRYPSETRLKLKSRKKSFVHNIGLNNPIVLKCWTEHGSITVVLCAKFQDDWAIEKNVMDWRNFARFEFKMSFGGYPILHCIRGSVLCTVKPVYNDHLMGYFSAIWSSSRWPRAT